MLKMMGRDFPGSTVDKNLSALQGTWVLSLVQEDPTCLGATRPLCHNNWTCPLEPGGHNYWAHVLQLLKPTCLEPVLPSWNAKVGSQEICGVTGKFGPGGQNEAEQRLWDVLDKHQLSSLDLMCHLRLVFPYCFSVCISVHWCNCDVKVPPLLLCKHQLFLLCLLLSP